MADSGGILCRCRDDPSHTHFEMPLSSPSRAKLSTITFWWPQDGSGVRGKVICRKSFTGIEAVHLCEFDYSAKLDVVVGHFPRVSHDSLIAEI